MFPLFEQVNCRPNRIDLCLCGRSDVVINFWMQSLLIGLVFRWEQLHHMSRNKYSNWLGM